MAYLSFDKLWRSEFYNNISSKVRFQDINLNQLKLKVKDSYKKAEKLTMKFESSDKKHAESKGYLDTELLKKEGHISYIDKD